METKQAKYKIRNKGTDWDNQWNEEKYSHRVNLYVFKKPRKIFMLMQKFLLVF